MAQLEPFKDLLATLDASLVYIAAEKRKGFFRPEKFLAEHPTSFPFLFDENRRVTKAYGVYHFLAKDALNIARPATFVVDSRGVAQFVYVGLDQRDRAPLPAVMQILKTMKCGAQR
jgi:peroxiredoxin